ncbi:14581_t:CDS:2 [Ambispora leptoticha]|uniref:14581_t:CDS:1 n=1 Tax=Ambispora leptoticha TaxID=144679 RepID=A0A9N8ZDU1_9GLOM|nr:14581_t:CDS:2 [Ambispora leptoticha]
MIPIDGWNKTSHIYLQKLAKIFESICLVQVPRIHLNMAYGNIVIDRTVKYPYIHVAVNSIALG